MRDVALDALGDFCCLHARASAGDVVIRPQIHLSRRRGGENAFDVCDSQFDSLIIDVTLGACMAILSSMGTRS